jgi:quercetin dioxygenase-like cupin family protein
MSGHWPDWRAAVEFTPDGPAVTVLQESTELKTVLVALDAGQSLPPHPGPAACFHILDGSGSVLVDDDEVAVSAGATVVVPSGARRSVRARTPLVFLGNLGDPGSEESPA